LQTIVFLFIFIVDIAERVLQSIPFSKSKERLPARHRRLPFEPMQKANRQDTKNGLPYPLFSGATYNASRTNTSLNKPKGDVNYGTIF